MHIKKTLTLKSYKKSEEKLELPKRTSNSFNEKLDLIKISKYTHQICTHSRTMYWLTEGKTASKMTKKTALSMTCQLKQKQTNKQKPPDTCMHAHTYTRKLLAHAITWMNLQEIMLNRKADPKHSILYGSIYVTFWNDKIREKENKFACARSLEWEGGEQKGGWCGYKSTRRDSCRDINVLYVNCCEYTNLCLW